MPISNQANSNCKGKIIFLTPRWQFCVPHTTPHTLVIFVQSFVCVCVLTKLSCTGMSTRAHAAVAKSCEHNQHAHKHTLIVEQLDRTTLHWLNFGAFQSKQQHRSADRDTTCRCNMPLFTFTYPSLHIFIIGADVDLYTLQLHKIINYWVYRTKFPPWGPCPIRRATQSRSSPWWALARTLLAIPPRMGRWDNETSLSRKVGLGGGDAKKKRT